MTSDDDILEAMQRYGGGFVSSLARLYRQADPVNQAKLKAAFPEYWVQYAEMVKANQFSESLGDA